jgi:hypothetical protein
MSPSNNARRVTGFVISSALVLMSELFCSGLVATAHADCSAPTNKIMAENCLAGNPAGQWDIAGSGDDTIQGFTTDISMNRGGTAQFKIDTNAAAYHLDIYRMGYYGGMGARKQATINVDAASPQPACLNDSSTGLIDCGNWTASTSWAVPTTATSGIYFAKVIRNDTGGASHIVFVVRDDGASSDILFQTSDTTWQGYNTWGGNGLYSGSPASNAYKVSYNRPFNTRGVSPENWVFNAEYPMVRFLEANGYDVSYFTGVDSDRRGNEILEHKVFMSVGHDAYWSVGQRANVEAARASGVNLAFFSGNEVFWKTRWESSISSDAASHRTMVSDKETHRGDPVAAETGTGRDLRFSLSSNTGRPENALTGTAFTVKSGTFPIEVPAADGKLRFWRNTDLALLPPGGVAILAAATLGSEWDEDLDNGFRPAGQIRLSTTRQSVRERILDNGSSYGPGTAIHHLTLHRYGSALVFGAGTVQWSWGLDSDHDRGGSQPDERMRQATVNLLADMGVQPHTIQAGLVKASASADVTAPTSAINASSIAGILSSGTPVTITGTASDAGGGVVGGVEVSVDGGASWHPADGRETWSYVWTPGQQGNVTLYSRATDDSLNTETPSTGLTVTVMTSVNAPVAVDDVYGTTQNMALTVPAPGVLGNDVGADGGSGSAAAVTGPEHGKLALNPDGGFVYTPAAGYFGIDTFTYKTDTAPNEATVTINIAGSPALIDTNLVDFNAGKALTPTDCSIDATIGDGEVSLRPVLNVNVSFSGVTLPADWSTTAWVAGGLPTLSAGLLTVDASRVYTDAMYTPGRSIEFYGTFGAATDQTVGFGQNFPATDPSIVFATVGTPITLVARLTSGGNTYDSPAIPGGPWIDTPHTYRIDWNTSTVTYYIDGNVVYARTATMSASMRPMISDLALSGATLVVDWIRMSPFSPVPCTFTSRPLDGGATAHWAQLEATMRLPAGATYHTTRPDGSIVKFETRSSGDSITWSESDWAALTGSAINSPDKRYLQYRLTLSTFDPYATADLLQVEINPSLPVASASDPTPITEGNSGTQNVTITVSLSKASTQVVTVDYTTANGSAVSPSDYVATSGRLTFNPGVTSLPVTVTVNGDTAFEIDEKFFLNLIRATNALAGDPQGVVTILDDDKLPTLSINDMSVTEGDSLWQNVNFVVTLSAASGTPVTVMYAIADGTAVAPTDYTPKSGTLIFAPGVTSQIVQIKVLGDITTEDDERYSVNLSVAVGANISKGQGVGTILNNDSLPVLSINDVSVTEGNAGTVDMTFLVALSMASAKNVTVNYATVDGTATGSAGGGDDYYSHSGTLTIPAGSTLGIITVQIQGDTRNEADEQFFVNLSTPANATIKDGQGVGTIVNDDAAAGPTVSIDSVTVTEGNSRSKNATFTITLSAASSKSVSVHYSTANGTAVAPADYASTSGTITFAPGQTSKTINVVVNGDRVREANETFGVNLSSPVNATIATGQGVGTIQNDD